VAAFLVLIESAFLFYFTWGKCIENKRWHWNLKKIQNIDRHNPGPIINTCHLSLSLDFQHRLPLKIADFFPAWITISPKLTIFLWRKKCLELARNTEKSGGNRFSLIYIGFTEGWWLGCLWGRHNCGRRGFLIWPSLRQTGLQVRGFVNVMTFFEACSQTCQIHSPWMGGYCWRRHRVVVPARQPM